MFGSRQKVTFQISYFSATITKPSGQCKMLEGGVKEMRQRGRMGGGIGGEGMYVGKGDVEEVEKG